MSTDVQHGEPLSARVSEEIRALMARRRMTGRELARRLGVSPSWVSYRLTDAQPIDLNDLGRIAAVLGVSVSELFPRQPGDTRRYPHTSDPLAPRLVATIGEPKSRQRRPLAARGQRAVRLPRPRVMSTRRPVTPAVN